MELYNFLKSLMSAYSLRIGDVLQRITDSTAQTTWAAATSQSGQLTDMSALWSGNVEIRAYSAGGTLLTTLIYSGWSTNTSGTPYFLELATFVSEDITNTDIARYCKAFIPGGNEIMAWDISPLHSASIKNVARDMLRIEATASLPLSSTPSWVPSTTWQWTAISGTRWNDVMNNSNSAGGIPSQAGDPVGANYDSQWDYGGIAYSRNNHEMWIFGGGHDGTTINALSKWSLNTNSPSVSMVCEPTAVADRVADWALGGPDYMSKVYHTETNPKPKSPHAYANNRYLDDIDEFLSFGIAAIDEPSGGSFGSFKVAGFPRAGSQWRADGYWPESDTTLGTYGTQNQLVFESHDRASIYYARKYTGLFRYTSAGVKTSIGGMTGGVNAYTMKGAAESASRALIGGGVENNSGTGWRLWFVDLTTGAATAVTVTGSWPSDVSGYQYHGLAWSDSLGKYFALLCALDGSFSGPNIDGLRVFSLTPTGASTITADEVTLTGTGPVRISLGSAMEFDPDFGVLLVAASPGETLFALKVA